MNTEDLLVERGKKYGEYPRLARIAQELKHIVAKYDTKLAATEREALDMICSKIARILNGDPSYYDNWEDIAGYAKLPLATSSGNTSYKDEPGLWSTFIKEDCQGEFVQCASCNSGVCRYIQSCIYPEGKR